MLHKATDLGLCIYVPSKGFLNKKRKVILLNTKEVFNSISDASRAYEQPVQNISKTCQKKRKYCGFINGEPAIWRYFEEYDESEIVDFDSIINHRSVHLEYFDNRTQPDKTNIIS